MKDDTIALIAIGLSLLSIVCLTWVITYEQESYNVKYCENKKIIFEQIGDKYNCCQRFENISLVDNVWQYNSIKICKAGFKKLE